MVDEWKPTDPASAAHLNELAAAVNALLNPGAVGTGQYGTTGTTFDQARPTEVAIFELTEDIKYPDPGDETFPAGWSVPPDVPYAENCKQIWLRGGTNTYGTDSMPNETVYFPTITDFDPGDDPILVSGNRVEATYDVGDSRWRAAPGSVATSVGTATVIRCQVNTAAVAITDNTFPVDGVSVISPAGASTPTVTEVNNVLHFSSVEDNQCIAFKDGETWYGIPEPELVVSTVITTVDYTAGAPSTFQAKTRDIVAFSQTAESSFATWHTMELVTNIVTDNRLHTDLQLQQHWYNAYMLEALTENTWDNWHLTASC